MSASSPTDARTRVRGDDEAGNGKGGDVPLTRREENRRATVAEIKALARRQLIERGPGALSLRAIAREMRTASSALYRYFASHDELISALVADAYASLADALVEARDSRAAEDPTGRWWAMSHGFRRWAQGSPADFALIFGTPVPGYQAPEQATGPAAAAAITVPLDIYARAVRTGAADPDRTQIPSTIRNGELLGQLLAASGIDHPPRLAAITLTGWTGLLGHLVAEIFGSLTRLVADTDELYRAHLRTVMLGMGFDANQIDRIDNAGPG